MIGRVMAPLLRAWDDLDDAGRRQATLVLLAGVLFLIHLAWYSAWYIEDAAITFAYARHLAEGDGFVTYPGGGRVEGFSNPTWTLALAALHAVGIDPWVGAKLLGAVLGLLGLPCAWGWARSVLGARGDLFPAVPALLLALSPQYVLWVASGLENSVMTACTAAGGALLLREVATRRRVPWSGLVWGVLAISRPEAPADAVIAAGVGLGAVAARRGVRSALDWAWRWALLAALPVLAWHGWAFAYFAWELPNTYFAKVHDDARSRPWTWSGSSARSWGYVRRFAFWHAHGFLLALYTLGVTGWRGWRRTAGLIATAVLVVLLVPGLIWLTWIVGSAPLDGWIPALGPEGALPLWPFAADPAWMSRTRIVTLGLAVALLPLVGLGRPGQAGRVLAAWLVGFTTFFAVYAGGDWMDGFRWFNLAIVPLVILLVDAVAGLWDLWRARPRGRWVATVPLVVVAVLSVIHTVDRIRGPETSPYAVGRRVVYIRGWADRLDLPLYETTWMDVDMGAHLWWAAPQAEIVDMAGLVDVPMGHHTWERSFVTQYVFEERRPDFAHVHGSWGRKTGLGRHPRFRQQYVELPDFPVSPRRTHEGNHVHRRHLFASDWPHEVDRAVRFRGGLELVGWHLPAPVVVPGGTVQVEVGWRRSGGLAQGRPHLVLSGQGRRVVHEIPVAYDLVRPTRWRRGEIALGDHRLSLPADLPPGRYDLAVVVLGDRGVIPPREVAPTARTDAPTFARGEVRWMGVLQIAPEARVRAAAQAGLDEVLADGPCDTREARWHDVRHHLGPHHPWTVAARSRARTALARCYAQVAARGLAADAPVDPLVEAAVRARVLDHRDRRVREVAATLADRLIVLSRRAEASGDRAMARARLRDALRLRPWDAWGRRHAERLRDAELGIDGPMAPSERLLRAVGGVQVF